MTNKLVIINSLKIPKIKKILLYEMKVLVSNYSCLQNPWLGGYRPQIPFLSVLNWICWTPPHEQNPWVRHCHFWSGKTTQVSSKDLGRTLRKPLAAFRVRFITIFRPDGNRVRCTHSAALTRPSWDATETASRRILKGFHRANAGRYRPPVLHIHLRRVDTCPTLLPLRYVL